MSNVADDVILIKNSLAIMTQFNAALEKRLDALDKLAPGQAAAVDLSPVLAAIAAIPVAQPADMAPVLDALADLKATLKGDVEPSPAENAGL